MKRFLILAAIAASLLPSLAEAGIRVNVGLGRQRVFVNRNVVVRAPFRQRVLVQRNFAPVVRVNAFRVDAFATPVIVRQRIVIDD